MQIYLKCLLVKGHILMQIYKNLLVSKQIIMQTYFKSRLVKCHNMMQVYEGFIFWDFFGYLPYYCEADVYLKCLLVK